ncbi:MAG: tRNA (adenosine(37)-N6)-dimethylallyltransferase MiaA [Flavobacteriaceae bacterium]|nr:tRNA (adenosine(37)-N6)-dimethylallyltransferase MiaA [Flavobacteriaceae bacterium]
MNRPKLITISGPTAVGKTTFAIALAKALNCSILSGDSRQFYKEMHIGTAVPSEEELNQVPHHFIQHKSIHDVYTVADFEKEALDVLESLFSNNQTAILVGGSNLYTDAVVHGLDKFPEVSNEISTYWKDAFSTKGINFLQESLKKLDPQYYTVVDLQNHVRLLRALGVCKATNKPYSSFLGQTKTARNFDVLSITLNMPREQLYERINSRVELMITSGLIDEVRSLISYKHLNALQTVGYREVFPYILGEISLEDSIENVKMNTRRFAKRQLTWLRNHPSMYDLPHDTIVDTSLLAKLGVEIST